MSLLFLCNLKAHWSAAWHLLPRDDGAMSSQSEYVVLLEDITLLQQWIYCAITVWFPYTLHSSDDLHFPIISHSPNIPTTINLASQSFLTGRDSDQAHIKFLSTWFLFKFTGGYSSGRHYKSFTFSTMNSGTSKLSSFWTCQGGLCGCYEGGLSGESHTQLSPRHTEQTERRMLILTG